jgi:hypothetical protein
MKGLPDNRLSGLGTKLTLSVAVEKLASEKSAKIKTRQEVFSSRLDIFYLSIFAYFEKKGVFQQLLLMSTSASRRGCAALAGVQFSGPWKSGRAL